VDSRNDSHFRQRRGNARVVGLFLLAALLPACSTDSEDTRPLVVATTTILGDIVANVAGDDARVEVIMPRGADPHDFTPSSRQVALIASADLVVLNGLGLEEGLDDVIEGARSDGVSILEVAVGVDPLPLDAAPDDRDPHVWLDPRRMAMAAGHIADALDGVAPGAGWQARADGYAAALRAADARIVELLDVIPTGRRLLVTNHDSLRYVADRYGFEVIGAIIPGGSTLAEPGSEEIAALVDLIDELGITAIFADTTEPATLAAAIADEADHPVSVVLLHTGSLGEPGTPAGTLIGMLEENARMIAGALG